MFLITYKTAFNEYLNRQKAFFLVFKKSGNLMSDKGAGLCSLAIGGVGVLHNYQGVCRKMFIYKEYARLIGY